MKLKDIELSIKVGDDAVQELKVDAQDQAATCFIASQEGAVSACPLSL